MHTTNCTGKGSFLDKNSEPLRNSAFGGWGGRPPPLSVFLPPESVTANNQHATAWSRPRASINAGVWRAMSHVFWELRRMVQSKMCLSAWVGSAGFIWGGGAAVSLAQIFFQQVAFSYKTRTVHYIHIYISLVLRLPFSKFLDPPLVAE